MRQIGTDRVVEVEFSDGSYRLFLEFYAGGNIVLTDADLTILALLRNVNEGEEHEQYRLGSKYNLELRQNFGGVPELTRERVRSGLVRALERQKGKKQGGKKAGKDALRKALSVTTTEFPPVLIDHALEVTGFEREVEVERVVESEELLDELVKSLQKAEEVVKEITGKETAKGYILAKRKPGAEIQPADGEGEQGEENKRQGLLYDDFHPFKPAQLSSDPTTEFLEFDGFNKAVDEFFSSIEGQRLEGKLQEREEAAKRKIEQARREQEQRIDGLQQVQELNVRKAQAIEGNVERVEEAVAAVNGLIGQGMDWVDIGRLIENEQGRQNPVAQTIKLPLKLHENTVTLLLSEYDTVEEEEMADETESEASDSEAEDTPAPRKSTAKPEDKRLAIDIDLALSPWANARQYYDQRRTAATKQERTAQASSKALKSTEQKVMADLKKGLKQEKDVLRNVRKPLWFEKFLYFISSDGYLVLAGKDAQQNEMLYRRYLRKGDIYVHADLHGAASVIIKNNPKTPEAPIPPSTLSQAGNMSVCTSGAWESKAVMSAWWVESGQVSKTAPTGEYLTTGGFMIRGKKNFLPPAQLLLGFGVMFRISEESKARHLKHRLGNGEVGGMKETKAEPVAADDGDDDFPDAGRDEDEDDDFPDAGAQNATDGEDDDDFPDAQGNDHDESDAEEEHEAAVRSNPLQGDGAPEAAEESEGEQSDEEEDAEPEGSVAGSAAETNEAHDTESADERSITKGMSHLSSKDADNAQPAPSAEKNAADAKKQQTPPTSKPKPAQKPRGKRGKAKKLASKYAGQDEEDRELAMQLLGSRKAEERREAEAAAKAARAETAEEARARRRAQHEKAQKEGLEAEEIRRLNMEEGVEDLDEEEASQLTHLDCFVGQPLPGDEILEAIPVCAPWQALGQYKYKAKMQPGQTKKGKAVREILATWVRVTGEKKFTDFEARDKEKVWPREAELIRGFKEQEVVGTVPVKTLRVMMGGGAAAASGGAKGGAKGKGKGGRGGKGKKK